LTINPFVDDQLLSIDWADEYDSDKDINKIQIHISGITPLIKSEELYRVFGQYGHIVQMKLSRDFENKTRTDYGFITFSSEKEAEEAISEFNYKEYFPVPLKVQYARKMSAIINHKKRNEDSLLLNKKRKNSNVSYEDDYNKRRSNNHSYSNNNTDKNAKINKNRNSSGGVFSNKKELHNFNNNSNSNKNYVSVNQKDFLNQNYLHLNNEIIASNNSINSAAPHLNFHNLIHNFNVLKKNNNNNSNNSYIQNAKMTCNPINNLNINNSNSFKINSQQVIHSINNLNSNYSKLNNINIQSYAGNPQTLMNPSNQLNQRHFTPNELSFDKNSKTNPALVNNINNFPLTTNNNQFYNQVFNKNQNPIKNFQSAPQRQYQQQNAYLNNSVNNLDKNQTSVQKEMYNHNQVLSPSFHFNNFNNNDINNPSIPINSFKNRFNSTGSQSLISNNNDDNYTNNHNIQNINNNHYQQMNQSSDSQSIQNNLGYSNQLSRNFKSNQSNIQIIPQSNHGMQMLNSNQNQKLNLNISSGGFQPQNIKIPNVPVKDLASNIPFQNMNQNINFPGNYLNLQNGFSNPLNLNPRINPPILRNNNLSGNQDNNSSTNGYPKQTMNFKNHLNYKP